MVLNKLETMIDPIYLPFTREELRPHFTMDADRNIDDFERSARAYREFLKEHPVTTGIPISISKVPRQIESFGDPARTRKSRAFFDSVRYSLRHCPKAFHETPLSFPKGDYDQCGRHERSRDNRVTARRRLATSWRVAPRRSRARKRYPHRTGTSGASGGHHATPSVFHQHHIGRLL